MHIFISLNQMILIITFPDVLCIVSDFCDVILVVDDHLLRVEAVGPLQIRALHHLIHLLHGLVVGANEHLNTTLSADLDIIMITLISLMSYFGSHLLFSFLHGIFLLQKQCAAERTQNLLMRAPPHLALSAGRMMRVYQGVWPALHPPTIR